jgi:DNA replication and repair protein RecF
VRVQHLSLSHFRNYERLELDLGATETVLWGDNAQGKSNLVEAIYYLATMRSFRASSDRDLIQWGQADDPIGFTRIAARFERGGDVESVEIILREGPRADELPGTTLSKRIRVNDAARRAIDAVGVLTAVSFAPRDLELVDGTPLLRRRYLDVTISQEDRQYCRSLAQYNRVVVQRNSLLRSIRERGTKVDELHFWNREMIASGAYVVFRRLDTLQRLGDLARQRYAELSATSEALDLAYRSTIFDRTLAEPRELEEIAKAYEARVADVLRREITLGASLIGPHRDDLTLSLGGHALADFGSRGQQRTAALALKLAEAEHLRQRTGESPVLLLDDVLSELDATRRVRVLERIHSDQQVILTTADPTSLASSLGDATWLQVALGRVQSRAVTGSTAPLSAAT